MYSIDGNSTRLEDSIRIRILKYTYKDCGMIENFEQQATMFNGLADPTRLKLLRLLCSQKEPGALCVGALTGLLGISQPAVSQHLRILKSAGLARGQRQGYYIHYSVDLEAVKRCQELLIGIISPGERAEGGPCSNCDKGKTQKT
jgi:ArsR family transcriptional regulator